MHQKKAGRVGGKDMTLLHCSARAQVLQQHTLIPDLTSCFKQTPTQPSYLFECTTRRHTAPFSLLVVARVDKAFSFQTKDPPRLSCNSIFCAYRLAVFPAGFGSPPTATITNQLVRNCLPPPPPPRCTWPVVTASTWWQALSAEVAVSAVKGAICQMFQRSNGEFGSTAFTILLPDGAGSRNCFLQLHVLPAYAANSGAHGSACVSELLLIEGKPPVEVEAGPSNDQAVDHHDLILL